MLFTDTPIGKIRVPSWEEKELVDLNDDELLTKAIAENKAFVISPATYAMIEKRFLGRTLQQMINPNVGMSHLTLRLLHDQPDYPHYLTDIKE